MTSIHDTHGLGCPQPFRSVQPNGVLQQRQQQPVALHTHSHTVVYSHLQQHTHRWAYPVAEIAGHAQGLKFVPQAMLPGCVPVSCCSV